MFHRFPHIVIASLAALTIDLSAHPGSTPTSQQTMSRGSNASEATQSSASPAQIKKADPDLASKLLTGEVAGVALKKLDGLPDLDSALRGADTQIELAGCLDTGITWLRAGVAAVTQTEVVSFLPSSDLTTPDKYREHAQKCSSANGTVAGNPVKQDIEQQQAPVVEGVNDLAAAAVSSESATGGKTMSTRAYLLTDSVNGNTAVAQSMMPKDKEPSSETVIEFFEARIEKIRN